MSDQPRAVKVARQISNQTDWTFDPRCDQPDAPRKKNFIRDDKKRRPQADTRVITGGRQTEGNGIICAKVGAPMINSGRAAATGVSLDIRRYGAMRRPALKPEAMAVQAYE